MATLDVLIEDDRIARVEKDLAATDAERWSSTCPRDSSFVRG